MKKILLTGATGYIGSHTALEFIEKGYEIVIVDNLYNSDISVLKNIEKITGVLPKFYEIDLKDKQNLEKVFKENKFDTVVHFAGLKAVGESCEKPFLYYKNNIIGSLNLFELMLKYSVKNIIFSSSATVYDSTAGKAPFFENNITGKTTNPYGTTKLVIENILRNLSNHKGLNVVNLRYFNPIGAHKSGFLGENPNNIPNNLLPYVMKVAIGELEVLKVFGGDYDTEDGTCKRDYIHVMDLADAHFKAFKFLQNSSKKIYEEINIGTGFATSVLEIIKMTNEVTGENLPYKITDRRAGDVDIVYCNADKAKKLFDWQAKLSVKEAVEDQYKFVINQNNKNK
ncbi:UDP-glucose 4-epimerase GalE [Candidatus Gracilibacteria bacterium]|nr:UDP-glucose 4-epimerase GalE [Candidatus Gracilibacteria bacterium]